MNTHRRLIKHELGHAIVALLSGLRVKCVWAPPPPVFDGPPENPDEPAGFVLARGGDRRARALALLGGPLAEGKCAPSWPIQPHTDDERKLAQLVGEGDELSYLETVRDAEQIVKSDEFARMNVLASELIASPPHELNERQLDDIKRTEDIMQSKSHEEDDDEPPDPRELEAELVRRGVLSEPHAAQYAQAVTDILGTENGDVLGTENGDHLGEKAYAHVREEWRNRMLNLLTDKQLAPDEPKPERKTVAPIQIATFEA